ncbi:MAG TPA: EFR1 family ferrodoxin [Methanocorpusculum sp.]|nr:EFR1 family ferrodoxin [Methanocorpusculum sp.]
MHTIIYYFTGTGNSLAAARMLQEKIADTELVPIAGLMQTGEKIPVPAGIRVGVVYPMYCGGMPNIVVRFFEQVDFSNVSYLFTLITTGGQSNGNPLNPTKMACEKAGHALNGSWWVQMPDNYIPLEGAVPQEKQTAIFAAAQEKIAGIVASVEAGDQVCEPEKLFGKLMRALGYNPFMKRMPSFDTKFTVSDACIKCHTCIRICPVGNIAVGENDLPSWQTHHCEGCLACLQFCPKQAISCGPKTVTRARYHHPAVTLPDMLNQKKVE